MLNYVSYLFMKDFNKISDYLFFSYKNYANTSRRERIKLGFGTVITATEYYTICIDQCI